MTDEKNRPPWKSAAEMARALGGPESRARRPDPADEVQRLRGVIRSLRISVEQGGMDGDPAARAHALWIAGVGLYGTDAPSREECEVRARASIQWEARAGADAGPGPSEVRPAGAVYLVQRGARGPFKIGHSENPRRRLAELQTAAPERLRIVATIPGDTGVERGLHARFAAHALGGEWFRPAPEILRHFADAIAGATR